jgi:SAM-dependent methyltransferase
VIKYDLDLFLQLNEEYSAKKLVAKPPPLLDAPERLKRKRSNAELIAKQIAKWTDLRGKVVLDFGCGKGDLDLALAEDFGCTVTGVDIKQRADWANMTHPKVERLVLDLSVPENAQRLAGRFDVIASISVLEHVLHPYRALEGLRTVLKPRGIAWLKANLYRGPKASHCYREVHFPWPHLLFTDEVFRQFYVHIGMKPKAASWINKLTHYHYRDYFERIGFEVLREGYSEQPIDEEFYARFEEILGRYPRTDLERDFINVILRPRPA